MTTNVSRGDVAKALGRLLGSERGSEYFKRNGYTTGMPVTIAAPDEPVGSVIGRMNKAAGVALVATYVDGEVQVIKFDSSDSDDGSDFRGVVDDGAPIDHDSEIGMFVSYVVRRAKRESRSSWKMGFNVRKPVQSGAGEKVYAFAH